MFDRYRPLMVLGVEIVITRIFFDTYPCADKKENYERFRKAIDDRSKDHERDMIRC